MRSREKIEDQMEKPFFRLAPEDSITTELLLDIRDLLLDIKRELIRLE